MLIEIHDDEDFVNYIDAVCETEEEVSEIKKFISDNKPSEEEVIKYAVTMRLKNRKHYIYNKE